MCSSDSCAEDTAEMLIGILLATSLVFCAVTTISARSAPAVSASAAHTPPHRPARQEPMARGLMQDRSMGRSLSRSQRLEFNVMKLDCRRADNLQGFRCPPQRMTRQAEHGDPLAIPQHVRGDGAPRIHIEQHYEIRDGHSNDTLLLEQQELVLKHDGAALSGKSLDALQSDRAHREAAAQMALQIDDLAVHQVHAAFLLADEGNRIGMLS